MPGCVVSNGEGRTPARNGDYDTRFVALLIDELEQLGHPCYPNVLRFRALVRADTEFKDLGPQLSLKPQLCGSEAIKATGIREPGSAVGADLCRIVGLACSRWLRSH